MSVVKRTETALVGVILRYISSTNCIIIMNIKVCVFVTGARVFHSVVGLLRRPYDVIFMSASMYF